jgi:outer membrane protein TolC
LAEDYLQRAFRSSALLRQRYWEWRAALERVPQAASPPMIALSLSHLFEGGGLAWERTTVGLAIDSTQNLPLPPKLAAEGRRALEEARAAAARFEAERLRLQAEVLSLHLDLALHAELLRIQEERVDLLAQREGEVRAAVEGGRRSLAELLEAQTDLDLARNEHGNLHAQLPPLVARMNALLGREPDSPVPLPGALPGPRPFEASDAEVLALAEEKSPELAALGREVAGAEEALARARLEWFPDVNPSLFLTGNVSQVVALGFMLPTRVEAIRGMIAEARAMLEAARAAREQHARDLAASFVLNLLVLRDAERQAVLFADTLGPRAELLVANAQASYAAGRSSLAGVVEVQLALLEVRLTLARLRVEREKALVAIESWSALDVEAPHPVRASAPM